MTRRDRPTRSAQSTAGPGRCPLAIGLAVCVLTVLLAAPVGAQEIVIGFTATTGDMSCPLHSFGFRTMGSSGTDAFDLVEPPLPPDDYLAAHFRMSHVVDQDPGRWRRDIRGTHDIMDGVENWELVFESSRVGDFCVIEFMVELGDAAGLVLSIDHLGEVTLISLPGTYAFEVTGPVSVFTLSLDTTTVPAESATWSRLRCQYR